MEPNSERARDPSLPSELPSEAEDQAFEDSLFDAMLDDEPSPRKWGGQNWSIALIPLGLAAAAYAVARYLKKVGARKEQSKPTDAP
jgi:hypothetical protein